jgi:hypothetical protein
VQTKAIDAKNTFHTLLGHEKVSNATARTFRNQVHGCLIARYGKDNAILTQFGFQPAKPRKTTVASKAVAALKVKATRAARGTKGKKQKAEIKGIVDPQVVATIVSGQNKASAPSPAQPTTPAQPAPAEPVVTRPAPAPAPSPAVTPSSGGTPAPGAGHSG